MSSAKAIDTIPTKSSSDMEWKAWYEILPFSTKDNNLLFARAWKVRGGKDANTSDLRKFLKDNGLTLSPDNVLGTIKDYELGVLETVGSVFKVGGTAVAVVWVIGGIFTAAMIWRIVTPENVGKGLDVAASAAKLPI